MITSKLKVTTGSQHVQDHLNSRNCLSTWDLRRMPCEFCVARNKIEKRIGRINNAVNCHHIEQSMRWQRTHNANGEDLLLVCKTCHDRIHAHNTIECRDIQKHCARTAIKMAWHVPQEEACDELWNIFMRARTNRPSIYKLIEKYRNSIHVLS